MDFYQPPNNASAPGLIIGRVVANHDDKHKGMVQVSYYSHDSKGKVSAWMRTAAPAAGKNRGVYFLPETGDEVLVAFINNDADNPCVIGSLWNQENTFPDGAVTAENTIKAVVTRSGSKLQFSDEDGKEQITLSTPKGMSIVLDDRNGTITILGSGGKNTVTLDGESGDITINANSKLVLKAKDVEMSADNGITMKACKVKLDASGDMIAKGARVEINGSGTAKLSSSGVTEVKGSMVKLNG